MISLPLQIRPSDLDSLGHVNNAAYVAYLEYALAELLAQHGLAADWRDNNSPHYWMMVELAIEYRLAYSFGDRATALVWLAEADQSGALFGCQLRCFGNGQTQETIRARSRWQRRASATDKEAQLPASLLAMAGQEGGDLPRRFNVPDAARDVRRYRWRHSVERSEVGPGGRAHPHVLFEWIEESILRASKEAGWPIERCLAEDFVVFQMRHDATCFSPPLLGEAVEVISRLVDVRRLRGTWHNEIRSLADGRLLGVNYSTGVFLNLAGRPTSPPPDMMKALQQRI